MIASLLTLNSSKTISSYWTETTTGIGVARIFSDDIFSRHPLIYVTTVTYYHKLPFSVLCGAAPHEIQPHFCLISTKKAYKIFFRRPEGVHLHPLHIPGYAYDSWLK